MRINLLILFFLCGTCCVAQENIIIHVKDQDEKAIPFFTVENVKYKGEKYLADSTGKAIVPYVNGMNYRIHALGFIDTIITLQKKEYISIVLNSYNLLKEVTISPNLYSDKTYEVRASRINQVNWWMNGTGQNLEIGKIFNFFKDTWLQKVNYKLYVKENLDFKKDVYLNIYRINERLITDLAILKNKKPGNYTLPSPDLVFSGHLSNDYVVSYKDNYLTFDLAKSNIYLESGCYVICIELMSQTSEIIKPYFSLQNECNTIQSVANARKVAWFTNLGFGNRKYPNIISDLFYKEKLEKINR